MLSNKYIITVVIVVAVVWAVFNTPLGSYIGAPKKSTSAA